MTQPVSRQQLNRMARSGGALIAEGAIQRIEQSVANFQAKNETTSDDAELYRRKAIEHFIIRLTSEIPNLRELLNASE